MAKPKLQKTLADYVVIAIAPALIMLLIVSLVFFLLEVTYTGQFVVRFHWILFWFVFASVLIARIAIEQGSSYASLFGFALAGATGLVVLKYVDVVFMAFCLLGVIWWCAQKLTWDCTLIDDSEDASGEGLLQVAGIDESRHSVELDSTEDESADTERLRRPKHWFQNVRERKGKPHAPGLWVVYFSLAALPLFGVGQLMIPSADASARRFGFQLLVVYIASAFGLLLTTSFLGLRRYLRQRRLQMPAKMTSTWLAMGTALAIGVLVLCLVIPRPQADYSITDLVDHIANEVQKASSHAFLNDDAGKGEGQRSGKGEEQDRRERSKAEDAQGKQGQREGGDQKNGEGRRQNDESGQKKQSGNHGRSGKKEAGEKGDSKKEQSSDTSQQSDRANDSQQQQNASGKNRPTKANAGDQDRDKHAPSKKANGDERQSSDELKSSPSTPNFKMPAVGQWIGNLVKWILYSLIALIVLGLVIYNRHRIMTALSQLINELLNLFHFRRATSAAAFDEEEQPAAPPLRPFADFQNPFLTGAAQKRSVAELVRYSFEALEAWASEQGFARSPDQTPLEFGQTLGTRIEAISQEANQVAQLYSRLAYANTEPKQDCLDTLEQLWRRMSNR